MKPIPAAIQAARELAGPIIAMTVVLVAVYVPIGFQGGLTGALFTEFAFTLVGAITVSAIIALTLSPMMTSRFLRPSTQLPRWERGLVAFIDRRFHAMHRRYERWLHGSLNYLPVTVVFALIILGSIYFLYSGATSELAPQEDQGVIITAATNAANSTLQQRELVRSANLRHVRGLPRDRPCLPTRYAGSEHRRHGDEAMGSADPHHRGAAATGAAEDGADRRRPSRRLPTAAPARQPGPADTVHHRHDGSVLHAEWRGAEIPAGRACERIVHLPRHRPEDRQAADRGEDRSQQGGDARPEDERRRQRPDRNARRRICELLRPGWPVVQGDPAGTAAISSQHDATAELLRADGERCVGATVHHCVNPDLHCPGIAQPLPAGQ